MERAPTPTSTTKNHESSDTPIYDQLMREFMSQPGEPDNSREPSNETPDVYRATNDNTPDNLGLNDAIDAFDASLSKATNESFTRPNDDLELTPEELSVKVWMEDDKNSDNLINQKYIVPSLNSGGAVIDKLRDIKDISSRKALLLDYREAAMQQKSARMKIRLDGMNPNSMRYRRLNRKRGELNIKLGDIQGGIARRTSAIENRSSNRDFINNGREISADARHQLLIVAKKVAFEKKERRKLERKIKNATNDYEREELKMKLAQRNKDSISKFRAELLKKVMKNANDNRSIKGVY